MGKRVLLVGDYEHCDFREAVSWLAAHVVLEAFASPADALARLRQGRLPDVIVLAQSRPGQIAQRTIEQLHAASPVSRLVGLLGSWCEGEQRSGRPWKGVVRIYWHQWQARMIPELRAAGWPAHSVWRMPRTATAGELSVQACRAPWPERSGLVAVVTRTRRSYEALSDACRLGGYATAWLRPGSPARCDGAAVILWDGEGGLGSDLEALRKAVVQFRPAPVVVLLDMVRRQDQDRARAAGAAAVLGKPFLVADLLWQFDAVQRLAGPAPRVSSAA